METPAIFLVLLLCAVLVLRLAQHRDVRRRRDTPWPFYARKPVPSPEQALYQRLVKALPDHIVLAGVELADVLGVKRGFDAPVWLGQLRHLRYDFVVCAKDATVLAAIALDGASLRPCEQTKERASAAAGVRLIRWQAKALPDPVAIQALVDELQMASFEETASSASASWWPAMPNAGHKPPAH